MELAHITAQLGDQTDFLFHFSCRYMYSFPRTELLLIYHRYEATKTELFLHKEYVNKTIDLNPIKVNIGLCMFLELIQSTVVV